MQKIALLCATLILASAGFIFADESGPIQIYYFPRPPLYMTQADGSAGGFLVELVRHVMQDAKIPHTFSEVPPKRVLMLLEQRAFACGIGWFKNQERMAFANFSDPIYQDQPLSMVVHKAKMGNMPPSPAIAQVFKNGLLMGAIDGFSYGNWVDGAMAQFMPEVYKLAGTQVQLLGMIALGRCDYTLMGMEEATWLLRNNPEIAAKLALVNLRDAPAGNIRYLMFSKSVNPNLVQQINRSIGNLIKSARYKEIIDACMGKKS